VFQYNCCEHDAVIPSWHEMKHYVREKTLPFVAIHKQPFPLSHYCGIYNSSAVDKS